MADVIPFKGAGIVGDGAELDPDQVLEACKGNFVQVVICGFEADGTFAMHASHGSREALWKLQRGINFLMNESE